MRCVSGPQQMLGCESSMTRTRVVPERGLPIMKIGGFFMVFSV